MKTDILKKKSNALWKAHTVLEATENEMRLMLNPFICFEYSITYCPGDGYCILNAESNNVAPMESCIKVIEDTGKLSWKDHEAISI